MARASVRSKGAGSGDRERGASLEGWKGSLRAFEKEKGLHSSKIRDLVVDTFRATVVPRSESLPGLAETTLLIDRLRGRAMTGSLFVDRASLAASRAAVAGLRHAASAKAHADVVGLEEFEVVHADVRLD